MIKAREPLFNYQATHRTVTKPVTVTRPVTLHALAGKPCPLCGCRVPKRQTEAERQRASRARRKAAHV